MQAKFRKKLQENLKSSGASNKNYKLTEACRKTGEGSYVIFRGVKIKEKLRGDRAREMFGAAVLLVEPLAKPLNHAENDGAGQSPKEEWEKG